MPQSIDDIDRKIEQIHAAGKTTLPGFNKLHNYLRMKSRVYYAWHNRPYSSKLHWLILSTQIVILAAVGLTSTLTPTPVRAAALNWDGGGTDATCGGNVGDGNKWSCAANWSGDVLPGSGDTVTFSAVSTKNATLDSAFAGTVSAITISSNYTGTITIQRDLTVSGNYSQSGGTVVTTLGNTTIGTTLILAGGTYTAPAGTLTITGSLTVSGTPTFNANGGTVTFNGSTGTLSCNNIAFNLVSFTHTTGTKSVSSNCNLPLGNNPTVASASGVVSLAGTLSGSGTLTINSLLNTAGTLSGFSGIAIAGNYTNGSGNLDFSAYSPFTVGATMTDSSGTVTLPSGASVGSLANNGGTVNAPSGTLYITNVYTNSGTFNANGGTVVFNSTVASKTLAGTMTGASSFNNLIFNGVGGSWSTAVALNVTGDLTLTAGTLAGAGTVTVNGNVTGTAGLIALTGTLEQRVASSKNFGSTSTVATWSFANLIFSNSTASTAATITTSGGGTGTITVSGILNIGKAGDTAATTLDAGNRSWTLSGTGGNPLQPLSSPAATLTTNTSTFTYSGNNASGNTTIITVPYYNLAISNSAETYVLAGDTTIANNYTNTNGILDVTASNYAMNVGGNWTKTAGTFTARSGTVTMNATSAGKTMTGDMTGVNSFYNLVFDGVGGGWTLSSSGKSTTNDFAIAHGAVAISAIALTVGGNWTDNGSFAASNQTVTFAATTTGHTISGNLTGSNAFNAVIFNGVGGGWTFNNSADVGGALTITNGDVTAPSGTLGVAGVFTNNGSFHNNNGTFVFNGTTGATAYIGSTSGSNAFYNFTVNGAGTIKGPASGTMEISNDLTVNAGIFSANTGSTTIVGGNVTGAGVVSGGSGNFEQRVSSNKTFGGSGTANWSFLNLTFSNASGTDHTVTTSTDGSGTILVTGVLALGKAGDTAATTLDAGSRSWTLSGTSGTPLQILSSPAGNFIGDTSTFIYSGNNASGNTTVPSISYYNLSISGAGEIFVPTGPLTVNNLSTATGTLQLAGALTINGNYLRTSGLLDVVSGQNYPITIYGNWSGAFTAQNGTVTFAGSATGRTIASAGFYNLIFDGAGGDWTMGAAITLGHDLTISHGNLIAPTGVLTIPDSFTNNDKFTNNSGTIALNSSTLTKTLNGNFTGSNSLYNLNTSGSTAFPTVLATDVNVLNDLSVGGTNSLSMAADRVVSIQGSLVGSGGAVGNLALGTVRMTSTSPGKTISFGIGDATPLPNLVLDGVGGSWTTGGGYCGIYEVRNLTILNGTLNIPNTVGCYDATVFRIRGSFINHGTFAMGGMNSVVEIYFNATDAADLPHVFSGSMTGDSKFTRLHIVAEVGSGEKNLIFTDPVEVQAEFDYQGNIGAIENISGNLTIGNNFDLYRGGLLRGGNSTFKVGGGITLNGGGDTSTGVASFDPQTSSFTLTGPGNIAPGVPFYDLAVDLTGTVTQQGDLTLNHNLSLLNGTLDASTNNYSLNLAGNLITGNGTYLPQAGTVTLNGSDQYITGSNTFHNLSKAVTSPATLTLSAGSTQTITGALTLNGTDKNLLSLHSGTPGSQWNLTTQSAPALHYLSVKDSHNLGATIVPDSTINNEGNNLGWQFAESATTTSPTPAPTIQASKLLIALPGQSFVNGTGIVGTPSQATAGIPLIATIYATDGHSQLASGTVGTVHISSSDTQAALPASLNLSGGQATAQVTLKTAGTDSLAVSATGISLAETSLTVSAAAPSATTSSLVSLTSPAITNEGITLAATIRDQYANPISGKKVTLTSSRSSDQLGNLDSTNAAGVTQTTVKALSTGASTYDIQVDGVAMGEVSITWSDSSASSTGTDTIKPIAKISSPSLAATGQTIHLKGTDSTDNIGIVSYQWNFPDGSYALGGETSYLLPQAGEVSIGLTVTDKDGNTATATATILVTHAAPTNVTARYQGSNLVVSGSAAKSATVVAYLLPSPTPYVGIANSVTGTFSIIIPIPTASSTAYSLTTVAFPANVDQGRWLGVVSQQVSSQSSQENTPDSPKVSSPIQPIFITVPNRTDSLPIAIASVGIGLMVGAFLFAYRERRKAYR